MVSSVDFRKFETPSFLIHSILVNKTLGVVVVLLLGTIQTRHTSPSTHRSPVKPPTYPIHPYFYNLQTRLVYRYIYPRNTKIKRTQHKDYSASDTLACLLPTRYSA
jgi:hypothetical protein